MRHSPIEPVTLRLLALSRFLIFTYTDKGALDGAKAFRGARRRLSLSRAGCGPSSWALIQIRWRRY